MYAEIRLCLCRWEVVREGKQKPEKKKKKTLEYIMVMGKVNFAMVAHGHTEQYPNEKNHIDPGDRDRDGDASKQVVMVVIVVLVVAIWSLQLWLETPNSILGVGYE